MNIDITAAGSPLAARQNPILYWTILLTLLICAILFLLYLLLRKIRSLHSTSEWIEAQKEAPTRWQNIRVVAQKYKLDKTEQKFLFRICRDMKAPNIEYLIRDENKIDELFKKVYNIQRTQSDVEILHEKIFNLRYKIERTNANALIISSSKSIPEQTKIFYVTREKTRIMTTLVNNSSEGLLLKIPPVLLLPDKRPAELSKAEFTFDLETHMHYMMTARIVRYQKDQYGHDEMFITHSVNLKPLLRRGSKRIDCNIPCVFSAVKLEASSKSEKGIEYDPKPTKYDATITDISKSGCQLVTDLPIKKGQYIHLEFCIKGTALESTTGLIVGLQTGAKEHMYILHISFVQISKTTQNRIMEMMYKYE